LLDLGRDICINLYNIMKDEGKDNQKENIGKFNLKNNINTR